MQVELSKSFEETSMMGLIDHPLTPLIVAWMEAVQRRTIYFSPKNADAEIVARDLLNAALAPPASPLRGWEPINKAADEVVSRVCEWDDRTSPDDFPEALLIMPSELHRELVRFAEDIGALSAATPAVNDQTVNSLANERLIECRRSTNDTETWWITERGTDHCVTRCEAASRDGVICPDDSCDIDDGVRPALPSTDGCEGK